MFIFVLGREQRLYQVSRSLYKGLINILKVVSLGTFS